MFVFVFVFVWGVVGDREVSLSTMYEAQGP